MKKLIGLAVVGSLFCAPAMAQQGTIDAILGANGPVQGLVTTLTTANAQPLIDGVTSNVGLIQGNIAAPLNSTLSGLLVNQDPGQVATGLQNTLTVTIDAVSNGLLGGGGLAGGGLPGLGGAGLPGLDALPELPGLEGLTDLAGGGLPGLPGAGGAPGLPGLDSLPGLDALPGLDGLPSLPGLPALPGA